MYKNRNLITSFFSKLNNINKGVHSPFVILIGISAFEIMKINFQIMFKENQGYTSIFDSTWVLSTVVGSSLLGLLSDRFIGFSWRKPIVLFGMISSLITTILFFNKSLNWSVLLIIVIINGISGSYLGAARAFYLG